MLRTAPHRGNSEGWAPGILCPRCGRRHRDWYAVAKCRWRPTCWVQGNPRGKECWATVSLCAGETTVMLHPTRDRAESSIRLIDDLACGGNCWRQHYLYHLSADGAVTRLE